MTSFRKKWLPTPLWVKNIGKSHRLLCWVESWLFRRISKLKADGRAHIIDDFDNQKLMNEAPQGALIAIFHEDLFYGPLCWLHQPEKLTVFASTHMHGQVAAKVMARFGNGTLSYNRKKPIEGLRVVKAFFKEVSNKQSPNYKKPRYVSFAVDGPSGPRRVVKRGIVDFAYEFQLPIYPVVVTCPKSYRLPSWDKMTIPKSNADVFIWWGKPIAAPAPTADKQAHKKAVKVCLENLQNTMLTMKTKALSQPESNIGRGGHDL